MDPTFQALLFSKPTTRRDPSTPANPSDPNHSGGEKRAELARASRYARLIPREALRISYPDVEDAGKVSNGHHKSNQANKNNGKEGNDGKPKDSNAGDGSKQFAEEATSVKKTKKSKLKHDEENSAAGDFTAGRDDTSGGGLTSEDNENSDASHGSDNEYELEDDGNIRVYRKNSVTGQLEMLAPQVDYDLIYFDDIDDEITNRNEDANLASTNQNEERGNDTTIQNATVALADEVPPDSEDAVPMEVDENHEAQQLQKQEEQQGIANENIIYIVRDPPTYKPLYEKWSGQSHNKPDCRHRNCNINADISYGCTIPGSTVNEEIDIMSSIDDDDDDDETEQYEDGQLYSTPITSDPSAKEVTHTASTVARVLAQRVEGFDKVRPRYGLEDDDEDDSKKTTGNSKTGKDGKRDKDKGKNVKAKKSCVTPGFKDKPSTSFAATSSSSPLKKRDGNDTSTNENATENDDNNNEDSEFNNNDLLFRHLIGHDIIGSLPISSNVTDGDDPKTLMQLSKMRIWQESHLRPEIHCVELDNWEDGIDWEGGADSEDERKDMEAMVTKKVERRSSSAKDESKIVSADSVDVDFELDCTEDFRFDEYRPPLPEGGYPKRRRFTQIYTDACQLLFEPRNPRLDALDLTAAINWEGGVSCDEYDSDDDVNSLSKMPLILQSSIAGKSVATLLAPCPSSRPQPFESHPNYQQRAEREMASEITSTANLSSGIILGESEALEKFKEMRQRKREQMAKDKQNRVTEVMNTLGMGGGTGRRITSSLMGPGGAERTGRPSRHAMGSTSAHDAEYVEQLELVYNHSLVRPELSLSEYRQFHRPRLPITVVTPKCPWQFQTRVITSEKKVKRGGVSTSADGSTVVGSYHAMMSAGAKGQNKIRNEADLSASFGDLVLLEYSEERPPLFMTKGMTCHIVNYYRGDRSRCPVSAGGGDRPLRKRHGDKAATKGTEPAGPSGRIERPPRLSGPNQYTLKSATDLIGVVSNAKRKKTKEAAALEAKKAKETAIDMLPEGVTEILYQKVHGPFIGEVEEGNAQTGLISNLFAAPIFRHDSEPTDFLMVLGQLTTSSRVASSGEVLTELGVVLRPLPANIYCVGQTEPRVKVFSPNTNDEKKFINAFVPYQVAKNLQRTEELHGNGLTFESIKDRLFGNTAIPQTQLRLRIKQVANFERKDNGIWSLKSVGEDDFPGVEALGRKVSPEGVAAYESECAGVRRLKDLGIEELYSGGSNIANVASVMLYLNGAAHAAMERKLKLKKVLEIKKRQKSPQVPYFQRAYEKLDEEYKQVKKRQEIAKFIYEEIQLSPWHLSGEFIDVHKRAQGSAMMKLTGIGDPSGLGEAYNFLREMDNKPNKATVPSNDGALNAQIKKITGTENDLRKLTMKQMASLLRSYGMKDKQIAVLKRWDRVHVIRDLSTKAASDGMGDELERFARGEKLRLSDQRQIYKERVQEIWRRQIAALSADPGNEVVRSESAIGAVKDSNEVEGANKSGADKDIASDDSDDEDDDFAAMLEMDMTSLGDANRLLAAQLNESGDGSMRTIGRSLDTQELSKDAREFAALQRQREEERAMQDGLDKKSTLGPDNTKRKKFKCIRRKITKTHPDGTQSVTFEFVVHRDKVEEIMERMKKDDQDKKKQAEKLSKKKKKTLPDLDDEVEQDTCVGHATFEDEDNVKKGRRKIKLKIKKESRIITKKAPFIPARKASHSKSNNGSKFTCKQAQVKKKKKRLREMEEEDLYKPHHRTKGTSNRKERGAARERMPHVIYASRLESIREAAEKRPNSHAFHKPVPRNLYPEYYEQINEPIDLQTIRSKIEKYEYKNADQFLRDFDLMRKNAVKFNTKTNPLAVEATEIYEMVKSTIEQNREELNQMEEAMRDHFEYNGRKKRKASKLTKKSGTKETCNHPAVMNTANVVMDGIETQVNLGADLSMLAEGSDSGDD